jgi:hypothetical protein
MGRTRRDLLRAYCSLTVVACVLAACFIVVLFSWPDPDERRRAMLGTPEPCCDIVVGAPILDGAEVLAAATETGSIKGDVRSARRARERSW